MVFTTSTCFYVIWKLELQCGDDSIHRHAKSAGQPIFFSNIIRQKHSQYEWQGKKFKGKSTYSISKLNMYKSKSGDIQQEK